MTMIKHCFLMEASEIATSRKLIPFFRRLFDLVSDGDLSGLSFLKDEKSTLDSLQIEESDDSGFWNELPVGGQEIWNIFLDTDTLCGTIVLPEDVHGYGIYDLLARSGVVISSCYENTLNTYRVCWTNESGLLLSSRLITSIPSCRPLVNQRNNSAESQNKDFLYEVQAASFEKENEGHVFLWGVAQYSHSPRRFIKFVLEPQESYDVAENISIFANKSGVKFSW